MKTSGKLLLGATVALGMSTVGCCGCVGTLGIAAYAHEHFGQKTTEVIGSPTKESPTGKKHSVKGEGVEREEEGTTSPKKSSSEPKPAQKKVVVVDSDLTFEQATKANPCASNLHFEDVKARQKLLTVLYWGMDDLGQPDGLIHQGQILVDSSRESDVQTLFRVAYDSRFPIHSVIPVSKFGWHDADSMAANNSSGWNFRGVGSALTCPKVGEDGKLKGSNHASLKPGVVAIDINDRQNPYYHSNGTWEPANSHYNPQAPGTLSQESAIIQVATAPRDHAVTVSLCSGDEWSCKKNPQQRTGLGMTWGGDWNVKDYQHLEIK